ncbi:MarR family transcriptional regulator [Rhodobacteraceae bacterium]|nr:MarR family transcriptional regulator [Paracoccaceae bacterium]
MSRIDDSLVLNNLILLNRRLRKAFDARASALGLTFSRAQALLMVARNEGKSQTELAEILHIETPTLNRALDGLEKTGFIERRAQADDRRIRRVFLTEMSKQKAEEIVTFSADLRHDLFHSLQNEELDQFNTFLQRLHLNLDDIEKNG